MAMGDPANSLSTQVSSLPSVSASQGTQLCLGSGVQPTTASHWLPSKCSATASRASTGPQIPSLEEPRLPIVQVVTAEAHPNHDAKGF